MNRLVILWRLNEDFGTVDASTQIIGGTDALPPTNDAQQGREHKVLAPTSRVTFEKERASLRVGYMEGRMTSCCLPHIVYKP